VPAGGAKATQIDMRDQVEIKAPSTTPMASCPRVHVSVSECWRRDASLFTLKVDHTSHVPPARSSATLCVRGYVCYPSYS
jgi:hypothetical protein